MTLCLWTSKYLTPSTSLTLKHPTNDRSPNRYEIANGATSWEQAERQIQAGKSTTVAVASAQKAAEKAANKRKAGEALEEAQKEAATLEGKRSNKKGKKSSR